MRQKRKATGDRRLFILVGECLFCLLFHITTYSHRWRYILTGVAKFDYFQALNNNKHVLNK